MKVRSESRTGTSDSALAFVVPTDPTIELG